MEGIRCLALERPEERRQPATRMVAQERLLDLEAQVRIRVVTGLDGGQPAGAEEGEELELAARVVGPLVRRAVRLGAERPVEPRHVGHLARLPERIVLVAALVRCHRDLAAEQALLRPAQLVR